MSEVVEKVLPFSALEAMCEAIGSRPEHIPADSEFKVGVLGVTFEEFIFNEKGKLGSGKVILPNGRPARRTIHVKFER